MRTFAASLALLACTANAQWNPNPQSPYSEKFRHNLWSYVNDESDRDVFQWHDTGHRLDGPGWTGVLLNFTSQRWEPVANYTNQPLWTHQLMIQIPDEIRNHEYAAMYITGGSQTQSPPDSLLDFDVLFSAFLAEGAKTITATLWQVPNQPLEFINDPVQPPKHRGEDALVAMTWYNFINYYEETPETVAFFPMAKSAVRALDVIQEYTKKNVPNSDITKFLVSGASKRGWTTWLAAPTDERIVAAAPIVLDMLNFTYGISHMYQAYGGWSFALKDYVDLNVTEWMDTPKLPYLSQVIDPLAYVENLTMPKLVMDSTGDEFFMPDDDYYWWGDLPGETYRFMQINAEHSFATGAPQLITSLNAWYNAIIDDFERPKFDWTMEANGSISIVAKTKPKKVYFQHGKTIDDKRRDFRLVRGNNPDVDPCVSPGIPVHQFGNGCLEPIFWASEEIEPYKQDENGYHYSLYKEPIDGHWIGFLGKLYFDGPGNTTFDFTTQVSILPNTFPYPPCNSTQQCRGQLV